MTPCVICGGLNAVASLDGAPACELCLGLHGQEVFPGRTGRVKWDKLDARIAQTMGFDVAFVNNLPNMPAQHAAVFTIVAIDHGSPEAVARRPYEKAMTLSTMFAIGPAHGIMPGGFKMVKNAVCAKAVALCVGVFRDH